MNRYAAYALKSEGNDYARTDAVEQCSFNGGTEFTFGMDIYCTMHNGVVFSQAGSVSCLLQSGSIVWKGNGWELIADKDYAAVMLDEWNHIDVVYGKSKVSLYLNGVCANDTEIGSEPVYSTEEYRYLGGYSGYIKNVRMVDHAMTEDEIRSNLIICTIPQEQLWLSIPFDSIKPEDKGKFKKTVQCKGFCCCKDFVKALYFSGNGYALLDEVSDNPGSDDCPTFTVVMRIFQDGYLSDRSILFENRGSDDNFQICLLNKEAKVQVNIGASQIVTDEIQAIKDCQWTDIAVSVNGTELKIYAGGALVKTAVIEAYVRKSYPHMVLGNDFTGAIDYFAVYAGALDDAYTAEIHNIEPYIYDDNISMLFLFHGEREKNMLGEGAVLLHGQAEYRMMEGTLYGEETENFDFRKSDEFSGTDLDEWEAAVIAGLGVGFVATAIGIAMNRLNRGLERLVSEQLVNSNAAQEILGNYTDISAEQLEELMTSSQMSKEMVETFTSTLTAGAVTGAAAVTASKSAAYPVYLGTGAGAAAVTAITAAAITHSQKPKDPPDEKDEDEKEPEKGYHIYLESIQFCNGSKGGIPLRTDFDVVQSVPEWNRGENQTAVCAYIAKQQSPEVLIRFRYMPAKDQESVKVKFYLDHCELLGKGESEAIDCSVSGKVYEAVIACKNNQLQEAGMGKYHGKVSFRFEPVGGEANTKTNARIKYVDMDIHTLCRAPIAPWSIEDKTKAPLIPALEIAAEIAACVEKTKIVSEAQFLHGVKEWYRKKSDFQLLTDAKYCRMTMMEVEFNANSFLKEVKGGNVSAGILDYYMFAIEMAAMEGIDFRLYVIAGIEDNYVTNEMEMVIQSSGIEMNECMAFGQKFERMVSRIYLIGLQNEKNDIAYYDILFSNSYGDWENVSEDKYRKEAVKNTCYVHHPIKLYGWRNNEKIEPKIEFTGEYFAPGDRRKFKNFVKKYFYYPQNQDCCHRVSFHTIAQILADVFEQCKEVVTGELKKPGIFDIRNQVLEYLKEMFFVNDAEEYNDEVGKNNYTLVEKTEIIKGIDEAGFKAIIEDDVKMADFLMISNSLLDCYNSSLNNLRSGFSNWNRSVNQKFDPEEWMVVFDIEGDYMWIVTNDNPIPEKVKNDRGFMNNGYYLLNKQDGIMLFCLSLIGQLLGVQYIQLDFGTYVQGSWEFPIFCSSANNFDFGNMVPVVPDDEVPDIFFVFDERMYQLYGYIEI